MDPPKFSGYNICVFTICFTEPLFACTCCLIYCVVPSIKPCKWRQTTGSEPFAASLTPSASDSQLLSRINSYETACFGRNLS